MLPIHRLSLRTVIIGASLLLGACGGFRDSGPTRHVDHTRVPNAVPKVEPLSKYGNPDTYEVLGKRYTILDSTTGFIQRGTASWYGTKFHGRRTSSGEPYNMYAMTAAHKTLPIPAYVEVTNLDNQRKVIVRVNDRGPFVDDRIIDLSYVAAKKLGIASQGTGRVEIRAIDPRTGQVATRPAPKPAVKPVAAANTSPPPSGQLYLQVGAFSDHGNAAQLLSRLVTAITENVLINRQTDGTQSVYRVRIGPLASENVVQKLREKLGTLGIAAPHIVVE